MKYLACILLFLATPCFAAPGNTVAWVGWSTPLPYPTLSSASLGTDGQTATLNFSEAVTQGTGFNIADLDLDASVTGSNLAFTLTGATGDGTATHTYKLATATVNSGETLDLDWAGTADGLEDSGGDDLQAIVSASVFNGSTQGGCTCSTVYASAAGGTTTKNINRDTSVDTYGGVFYTPDASISVCGFRMYPKAVVGDITAKGYKGAVYSLSGTALDTAIGVSSTVTGSASWSPSTPVDFLFATPVSVTASTEYGVLVYVDTNDDGTPEVDTTNYLNMGYGANSDPYMYLGVWRSTLLSTSANTAAVPKVEILTCE